jgi:MraZ protein
MLLGEYTYQLGPKNRVALPKKLRDQLGEEIILTRGYEGCVLVVKSDDWHHLLSDVFERPFFDQDARQAARFLIGGAHEVVPDNQGRFVVPESLVNHANLESSVVFVGLGSWVELWSAPKWQEQQRLVAEQSSTIAQRLAEKRSGV